ARDPDGIIEGAETLRQFRERVVNTINELANQHPEQKVLIVTHGGVLDIVWREANGIALQDPQKAKLLNASINRVCVEDGQWSLIKWADTGHLESQSDNDVTV